jgi:hypothetical protein
MIPFSAAGIRAFATSLERICDSALDSIGPSRGDKEESSDIAFAWFARLLRRAADELIPNQPVRASVRFAGKAAMLASSD